MPRIAWGTWSLREAEGDGEGEDKSRIWRGTDGGRGNDGIGWLRAFAAVMGVVSVVVVNLQRHSCRVRYVSSLCLVGDIVEPLGDHSLDPLSASNSSTSSCAYAFICVV